MAQLSDPPAPESHAAAPVENHAKIVWTLAWPAVVLTTLQTINSLIDRFFIGHLPKEALTAHGGALSIAFLMFSLAIAVGTAATALVSRAYGAGQRVDMRRASRQSLNVAIIGGLLCMGLLLLARTPYSSFLLPNDNVQAIRLMSDFLAIYALGVPAVFLIQTLAGSLRAIGDTRSPMVLSGFQIVLHVVLNFFLVLPPWRFGPWTVPSRGWGLQGTAISLTASIWIASLLYVYYASLSPLGPQWKIRLPSLTWVRRILNIATPATAMALLRVGSYMCFTYFVGLLANGSDAIAAMTTGFAIEPILFMPAFGLASAAAALVGQSLGMGKPQRAERLAWIAGHYGALITLLLAAPVYFEAPRIATILLGDKPEIIAETTTLLRYLCLTEVFFSYSIVMMGAMQGAGETTRPMWITFLTQWIFRIPLLLLTAVPAGTTLLAAFSIWNLHVPGLTLPFSLGLGTPAAWLAIAITQALHGIFAIWAFRQGQWKLKEV